MKLMTDLNNKSIPKIVHYCWFGPNNMEGIHRKCIKSWKKNLSGFQFMRWDESNVEIAQHPFLETAYNMKKWAFVSDYVRLQKLYEFGGIYLDTDMLLIKPLDKFLSLETFFGAENLQYISCGIIGAKKDDSFISNCLKNYNDIVLKENNLPEITIPQLITSVFRSTYDYEDDFSKTVKMEGITVFPSFYFYSLPYKERNSRNKKKYVVESSYAVHLWDESWKDHSTYNYWRKGKYWKGIRKLSQRSIKDYSFRKLFRILTALLKSRA